MSETTSRQSAGGVARAAKLSPEDRRAIASKAAQARWSKDRPATAGKPRWADLEAEGWRRVSVRLSPSAAARLDALMAAHGWDADDAIAELLRLGLGAAAVRTPEPVAENVVKLPVGSKPADRAFKPHPKPGKPK